MHVYACVHAGVYECIQMRRYGGEKIVQGSRGNITYKENAWNRIVFLLF